MDFQSHSSSDGPMVSLTGFGQHYNPRFADRAGTSARDCRPALPNAVEPCAVMPAKTPGVARKAQVLLGSCRADTFPGVQDPWQWEACCLGKARDTPGNSRTVPSRSLCRERRLQSMSRWPPQSLLLTSAQHCVFTWEHPQLDNCKGSRDTWTRHSKEVPRRRRQNIP